VDFVLLVKSREAPGASPAPTVVRPPAQHSGFQQSVRFCQASDGVHLAVASAGVGMPLVKTANWLNHIEFDGRVRCGHLYSPGWQLSANSCGMTSAASVSPIEMSRISHLSRSSTISKPWLTTADFTVSRTRVPATVQHESWDGDSRQQLRDVDVPFEHGLMLARGIPNARFVALESKNHLILSHEPAWVRFIDEICGFLGEDEPQRLTAAV
jgi:hypothetical protein